jgi:hypothetical protein
MKTELEQVIFLLYRQLNEYGTRRIKTHLNSIKIDLWRNQYRYYELTLNVSTGIEKDASFETSLSISSINRLGWHTVSPDGGPFDHWVNINYIDYHVKKYSTYNSILLSLQTFIIQWV